MRASLIKKLSLFALLFLTSCGLLDGPHMKNLAISPNNDLLAVSYRCGSEPMRIGLLDTSTFEKVSEIIGEQGRYADGPTFSNDGKKIAFTSGMPGEFSNGIYTYDIKSRVVTEILKSQLPNGLLAYSPDNKKLSFARAGKIRSANSSLRIGDVNIFTVSLETGEIIKITKRGRYALSGLDYISSNKLLVSGPLVHEKKDAAILTLSPFGLLSLDLGKEISNVQFADTADTFFYVAHANIEKHGLYDYEVFSQVDNVRTKHTDHQSFISALTVSPSGRYIAFLSDKKRNREYKLFFEDLELGTFQRIDFSILEGCK